MKSWIQKNNPVRKTKLAQTEIHWLRRFGFWFPLLGLPIGLTVGAQLWRVILMDPAFGPQQPSDWFNPRGLAIGLFLASIPVLWRAGIWLEQRFSLSRRPWPIAPLLAVVLVLLVEVLFRTPLSQSIFWQSVTTRSGNQHLAREVSLLRMEAAVSQSSVKPGLVILGSSQLVFGIDCRHLASQTGQPVYRRAVAGLFPSELVASQGWSDFNRDNRLVMMLSGFDLGARQDLYPDAIRPLATPSGMRNLTATAELRFIGRHWRSMIDLCFAAASDLWRSRDYARFLMEHPFAPAHVTADPVDKEALAEQKKGYTELGGNEEMVMWCQRALDRFFGEMSGHCREIIVFEGQLSPTYPGRTNEEIFRETRQFLLRQHRLGRIRFVPLEEQNLDLEDPALWRDKTHVNDKGRRLLTDMVARFLSENPRPSD